MAVTIGGTTGITIPATATNQSGAVAWVNFNGVTTAVIRAAYNVGSVTRNSAGNYTINFSTALADSNYCATIGATSRGTGSGTNTVVGFFASDTNTATNFTATALQVLVKLGSNGASEDIGNICVAVFR